MRRSLLIKEKTDGLFFSFSTPPHDYNRLRVNALKSFLKKIDAEILGPFPGIFNNTLFYIEKPTYRVSKRPCLIIHQKISPSQTKPMRLIKTAPYL